MCIFTYFTGQQNITFFFVPRGKISKPNRTFNAEFKYVSSFSPSPTVCLWQLSLPFAVLNAPNERACTTDAPAGYRSDHASLSAATWSIVWATAVRSSLTSSGMQTAIRHFDSGWSAFHEQCWTGEGKELTNSSYCTSLFHVFDDGGSNFLVIFKRDR
jgi:hypothetical protein